MSHHGNRGYTKTKQIRIERRDRAALVAKESGYSALSLQEKLARLPVGGAKRQRARLEAQIQAELKAQEAKKKEPVAVDPAVETNNKKRSKKEGK